MDCSTKSREFIWFWNFVIVAGSFVLVHLVWHHAWKLSSFSWDWHAFYVNLVLAAIYAHFYNKISRSWRFSSKRGFVHRKTPDGANFCGRNWPNFWNALIFGGFMAVVIFLAITLAGMFVSTIFIYVLDGIRGAVPPLGSGGSLAVGTQIIVATAGVELLGKTEDQPRG